MEDIWQSLGDAAIPAIILLVFVILVLARKFRRRGGYNQAEIRAGLQGHRQSRNKHDERQDFDVDDGDGDGDGGD